jgi:hypothetical protein
MSVYVNVPETRSGCGCASMTTEARDEGWRTAPLGGTEEHEHYAEKQARLKGARNLSKWCTSACSKHGG